MPQEQVAKIFYTHGLFCASHPYSILFSVVCITLTLCYPLVNTPLKGDVPVEFLTRLEDLRLPDGTQVPLTTKAAVDASGLPRWYKGPPVGFVQQFVVKATVSPWNPSHLDPIDALRAPLSKVFDVLEEITTYKHQESAEGVAMVNLCLRVSEPMNRKQIEGLLPEYSCLILSPANLWRNQRKMFYEDPEVLRTLYKRYSQTLEVSPGIKAVLFGLPWKKTGISRYFIRNRQRTISFAVTVMMKTYDPRYLEGLRGRLETVFPETVKNANNSEIDYAIHLHYKDINIYFEYIHLIILYLVLLLYLYFSVSKIELVKSKWGLAFSAVVTVVSSLLISVSMCSQFGLTPTLNGGEIFPYLVVLIGVENVLVVTKSVVSTPIELDVKYRVATGLSREGWSITKNLLIELAIVIVGFFTFVPAIQEFCLFALVGIFSDFFLQMIFFVTVLSLDIRRMELSDLHKHKQNVPQQEVQPQFTSIDPLMSCPFKSHLSPPMKSKVIPRLNLSSGTSLMHNPEQPTSPRIQHEAQFFQNRGLLEIPRRIQLIYFWANNRLVQRIIMVCTVVWIGLIVYKTGLVQHLTNSTFTVPGNVTTTSMEQLLRQEDLAAADQGKAVDMSPLTAYLWSGIEDTEQSSVEHDDLETWRKLSPKYWPTVFGYYNISVYGRYLTVLPTIHLSAVVPPEEAIELRKSRSYQKSRPTSLQGHGEEQGSHSQSSDKSQHSDRGPDKLPEEEKSLYYYSYYDAEQLQQFYPKSHGEFVITVSLGVLSVICVTYFVMLMYRCMCSRKYSKWRASWNRPRRSHKINNYIKQIKESVPIVLRGHVQEIECLVTEGSVIISSCLGGELRVWDSLNGECLHRIQRKSVSPPMTRKPCEGRNIDDSDADLYDEYHGNSSIDTDFSDFSGYHDYSPRRRRRTSTQDEMELSRRRFENEPDLSSTIETNFYNLSQMSAKEASGQEEIPASDLSAGYNFTEKFGQVFKEHQKHMEEKQLHDSQRKQDFTNRANRSKSWSEGDMMSQPSDVSSNEGPADVAPAPIWSLACKGNLIVAGCGNGRVEFWDASSGALKCVYAESSTSVTAVNLVGKRVICARIDGAIDFLELETFQDNKASTPLSPNSLHKKIKGHSRHLSHSRNASDDARLWNQIIHCTHVYRAQAHQRPVTVLQTEGGRVVSGSQDFTLKVFRLEDCQTLYTLHGHAGSITTLYLDKCPPYAAVSGSADGTIRLWDLLTGSCVHKVKGHDGTVVALTCTEFNIISSGLDDRLCVWERKRGHLLYSVDMETSCGSSMTMLCGSYLVTGGQGSLYLWDVNKGELVRIVNLEDREKIAFIHHIQSLENSTIVCDFGNEIKVIHFPLVLEKVE